MVLKKALGKIASLKVPISECKKLVIRLKRIKKLHMAKNPFKKRHSMSSSTWKMAHWTKCINASLIRFEIRDKKLHNQKYNTKRFLTELSLEEIHWEQWMRAMICLDSCHDERLSNGTFQELNDWTTFTVDHRWIYNMKWNWHRINEKNRVRGMKEPHYLANHIHAQHEGFPPCAFFSVAVPSSFPSWRWLWACHHG